MEMIQSIEAEIVALEDQQETADAEWRHMMLNMVHERAIVESIQQQRLHSAELEKELAEVMLAKRTLEEENLALTEICNRKRTRGKLKMITIGLQTDSPSTEELENTLLTYQDKVALLKGEIMESTALLKTIKMKSDADMQSLKKQIEQVYNEMNEIDVKIKKFK